MEFNKDIISFENIGVLTFDDILNDHIDKEKVIIQEKVLELLDISKDDQKIEIEIKLKKTEEFLKSINVSNLNSIIKYINEKYHINISRGASVKTKKIQCILTWYKNYLTDLIIPKNITIKSEVAEVLQLKINKLIVENTKLNNDNTFLKQENNMIKKDLDASVAREYRLHDLMSITTLQIINHKTNIKNLSLILESKNEEITKLKTDIKKYKSKKDNEEDEEEEDQMTCIICITNNRNMVFSKCKHMPCCLECSLKLENKCPICREKSIPFKIYM